MRDYTEKYEVIFGGMVGVVVDENTKIRIEALENKILAILLNGVQESSNVYVERYGWAMAGGENVPEGKDEDEFYKLFTHDDRTLYFKINLTEEEKEKYIRENIKERMTIKKINNFYEISEVNRKDIIEKAKNEHVAYLFSNVAPFKTGDRVKVWYPNSDDSLQRLAHGRTGTLTINWQREGNPYWILLDTPFTFKSNEYMWLEVEKADIRHIDSLPFREV